jgi:hypothetical protein
MTHQTISFIKSGIRILGYLLICSPHPLWIAGVILVVSEAIGIWEEIGQA